MTKEEIAEFADNNYELTINQTTKLTLKEGDILYGFFKRHRESETYKKLQDKNKWEFVVLPQENDPPKPSIIHGEDVVHLEVTEI
jgi:glutathione peroxidase-family protein